MVLYVPIFRCNISKKFYRNFYSEKKMSSAQDFLLFLLTAIPHVESIITEPLEKNIFISSEPHCKEFDSRQFTNFPHLKPCPKFRIPLLRL